MTDPDNVPTLDPTDGLDATQTPSGMWFVRHRDFPGCLTAGHTREDAVAQFWRDAAILTRLRLDSMTRAPGITDATLHALADDAFEVLNWARRMGMKRDQQQAEVVKAFRLTLDKAGASHA